MAKPDKYGVFGGRRYVKLLEQMPHGVRHGRVVMTQLREVGNGAKLYRDTYEYQVKPPVFDEEGKKRVLEGGEYIELEPQEEG